MILHRIEEKKLRAQFVLQENLNYQRNRKKFQVNAGEYNLVWAPGKDTIFHFGKDKEYHFLHIAYEPSLIRQLQPGFPSKDILPDEQMAKVIKPQLKSAIDQIISIPYQGDYLRFYYENQVRDILFHILFSKLDVKKIKGLSEQDILQIEKVEQLILNDLSVHYTIPELARKVKMGQFKLKSGFKKVTGMGMFECLKEARLQRARQLLLETDLMVRNIFEEVGYESITGFIDAFRKRFGLSPSSYRKKHQLNH